MQYTTPMRVALTILVILIVLGGIAVGYLVGVTQKPIPLPGKLPDVELSSLLGKENQLQGLWKVEQILAEDDSGNPKTIVQSAPGATESYFLFEKDHVCTEGILDIHRQPQPCRFYTTYSVKGNTILIDQPSKPAAEGTWAITNNTLEITVTENHKTGKFVLRRLPYEE